MTYSAPSGFHDDCVIALALANSLRFTGAAGSGYMAALQAPRRNLHQRMMARALPM